jgi:Arc/MetJ-type ribon-helix-helix transcriptional regulator
VRLPDELVDFVDDLIARGDGSSRASIVTRALERERRLRMAERDVEILKRLARDDDMDSLAEHGARQQLGIE